MGCNKPSPSRSCAGFTTRGPWSPTWSQWKLQPPRLYRHSPQEVPWPYFYGLKWRLLHGLMGDFQTNNIEIPLSLQWLTSSEYPVLATFTLAYECTATRVVQLFRSISFLLHFAFALASIFAIAHCNAITSGAPWNYWKPIVRIEPADMDTKSSMPQSPNILNKELWVW